MDENRNRDKKIKYHENLINENDSENEDNNNYDSDYEYVEFEYNQESINIIQKNLLDYVERRSLPLCEYLSLEKISNFISKIIN